MRLASVSFTIVQSRDHSGIVRYAVDDACAAATLDPPAGVSSININVIVGDLSFTAMPISIKTKDTTRAGGELSSSQHKTRIHAHIKYLQHTSSHITTPAAINCNKILYI